MILGTASKILDEIQIIIYNGIHETSDSVLHLYHTIHHGGVHNYDMVVVGPWLHIAV